MGTKERIIVCLSIKIIKKIGILRALKAIAEKTEGEADDIFVGMLTTSLELAEQYYCQGKPIEELEVE